MADIPLHGRHSVHARHSVTRQTLRRIMPGTPCILETSSLARGFLARERPCCVPETCCEPGTWLRARDFVLAREPLHTRYFETALTAIDSMDRFRCMSEMRLWLRETVSPRILYIQKLRYAPETACQSHPLLETSLNTGDSRASLRQTPYMPDSSLMESASNARDLKPLCEGLRYMPDTPLPGRSFNARDLADRGKACYMPQVAVREGFRCVAQEHTQGSVHAKDCVACQRLCFMAETPLYARFNDSIENAILPFACQSGSGVCSSFLYLPATHTII